MDVKEHTLIGGRINDHWYYRSKQLALDSMLQNVSFRRVLDMGAGSAVFAKHLLERGAESAVCVDSAYGRDREECFDGKPIAYVRELSRFGADLVLLMDVLEHVDDDVDFMRSSLAGGAPGAFVLISVPAYQSLFSAHDRFLEHRRRYTKANLERAVSAVGLDIVRTRYFFAFIFPLVAIIRLFQKNGTPRSSLTLHPPFLNRLLTTAHRFELPLFRYNRLFGLSIFCLARMP